MWVRDAGAEDGGPGCPVSRLTARCVSSAARASAAVKAAVVFSSCFVFALSFHTRPELLLEQFMMERAARTHGGSGRYVECLLENSIKLRNVVLLPLLYLGPFLAEKSGPVLE